MVSILFHIESHYLVNRKKVIQAVDNHLKGKVHRACEVSISVIGNRRMHALNVKYRKVDATTDVLSFPLSEQSPSQVPFIEAPDNKLRLGDIVVSYPEAVREATQQNKLVDDVVIELVLHGLNHLLGIHHPE
ncbi:MAG: rRNA maturation RNase YbeY [Candidatus Schekmanbacteria bacterium RBG_13_48_7]|uniref:rRNA maturation RNase YbeY n=1 Tax=Candidatus Schekmanbacteria bacterium RBG_13_48_7 TaxID=1817878 RepID=A0A1F7RQJ9_9BACT|nr:MAG: rRNA maturation RNase YbeY [Candidatus Schekmanbacteria bacterium RBG_13_48_7]